MVSNISKPDEVHNSFSSMEACKSTSWLSLQDSVELDEWVSKTGNEVPSEITHFGQSGAMEDTYDATAALPNIECIQADLGKDHNDTENSFTLLMNSFSYSNAFSPSKCENDAEELLSKCTESNPLSASRQTTSSRTKLTNDQPSTSTCNNDALNNKLPGQKVIAQSIDNQYSTMESEIFTSSEPGPSGLNLGNHHFNSGSDNDSSGSVIIVEKPKKQPELIVLSDDPTSSEDDELVYLRRKRSRNMSQESLIQGKGKGSRHKSRIIKIDPIREKLEGKKSEIFDLKPDPDGGRTTPVETQDLTCAICLSDFENRAFLDECFHSFCFACILQWAEVVKQCPLCKTSFKSLIHTVTKDLEYQQYFLDDDLSQTVISKRFVDQVFNEITEDRGRFHYRSTLTTDRRRQLERERDRRTEQQRRLLKRRKRYQKSARGREAASVERRKMIYRVGMVIKEVKTHGRPRERDISADFMRSNPAQTHRLVGWLLRDIRVLVGDNEEHIHFIMHLILSLIKQISMDSEDFYEQLEPFFSSRTRHFIRELISFAKSPYDLEAYDANVVYDVPTADTTQAAASSSTASFSSVEHNRLRDKNSESPRVLPSKSTILSPTEDKSSTCEEQSLVKSLWRSTVTSADASRSGSEDELAVVRVIPGGKPHTSGDQQSGSLESKSAHTLGSPQHRNSRNGSRLRYQQTRERDFLVGSPRSSASLFMSNDTSLNNKPKDNPVDNANQSNRKMADRDQDNGYHSFGGRNEQGAGTTRQKNRMRSAISVVSDLNSPTMVHSDSLFKYNSSAKHTFQNSKRRDRSSPSNRMYFKSRPRSRSGSRSPFSSVSSSTVHSSSRSPRKQSSSHGMRRSKDRSRSRSHSKSHSSSGSRDISHRSSRSRHSRRSSSRSKSDHLMDKFSPLRTLHKDVLAGVDPLARGKVFPKKWQSAGRSVPGAWSDSYSESHANQRTSSRHRSFSCSSSRESPGKGNASCHDFNSNSISTTDCAVRVHGEDDSLLQSDHDEASNQYKHEEKEAESYGSVSSRTGDGEYATGDQTSSTSRRHKNRKSKHKKHHKHKSHKRLSTSNPKRMENSDNSTTDLQPSWNSIDDIVASKEDEEVEKGTRSETDIRVEIRKLEEEILKRKRLLKTLINQ